MRLIVRVLPLSIAFKKGDCLYDGFAEGSWFSAFSGYAEKYGDEWILLFMNTGLG